MNSNNNTQKIVASFVVILAVVLVTAVATSSSESDDNLSGSNAHPQAMSTGQGMTATDMPSAQMGSANGMYKDGSYSAQSEYSVPSSYENIKVTVTLKNGVVTDSQVVNSEGDHESARYQQRFASSYKSYVVGKKINDIKLSVVAGASDTTDGFNNAIEQIVKQATS